MKLAKNGSSLHHIADEAEKQMSRNGHYFRNYLSQFVAKIGLYPFFAMILS